MEYFDLSDNPSKEEATAWRAQFNSVQHTLMGFTVRQRARFLKHYRPFVYDTFIKDIIDIDDPSDDVDEEVAEAVESWFKTYFYATSEDDLSAIHAIDQVEEHLRQRGQAIADVLADIMFDGNPPEIDHSGKQPWER